MSYSFKSCPPLGQCLLSLTLKPLLCPHLRCIEVHLVLFSFALFNFYFLNVVYMCPAIVNVARKREWLAHGL